MKLGCIFFLLNLTLTDWYFDTGHGPFSHMFDGKFLPSIDIKTKVTVLSLKVVSNKLTFFNHSVLWKMNDNFDFNFDQKNFKLVLSRMQFSEKSFPLLFFLAWIPVRKNVWALSQRKQSRRRF